MIFQTYVSQPVTIEAFLYDPPLTDFLVLGEHMRYSENFSTFDLETHATLEVQTISGQWVEVPAGYYIIKEKHGAGYYPCEANHFNERYKPLLTGESSEAHVATGRVSHG